MSAALTLLALVAAGPRIVVAIDPGHGTAQNSGATSVLCESEAAVNLDLANDLARMLQAAGDFRVHVLRGSNDGPSYRRRIRRARAVRADVLLSIHGDYRGAPKVWPLTKAKTCPRNDTEPGFAILFSDEGPKHRVDDRVRLARAIATHMTKQTFVAYSGVDYGSQYDADDVAGVFRDRRGLFMLRRPAMPSVIIETHHLLHLAEHRRWLGEKTRRLFADAIIGALRTSFRSNHADKNTQQTPAP